MNTDTGARAFPALLLSTGSLFHLPLPVVAAIARDAEFDGLELIVNSPDIVPGPALAALDTVCPMRSLHAPFRDWSRWGGHLASWRATTALANALPGCTNVTLHPPGMRLADAVHYRWFNRATDLHELLDAKGRVGLSLENLSWAAGSPFTRDPLERLLEQCEARHIGLTLDVCHLGVSGRDVLAALDQVPADILANVHFSDARGHQEHLFPGRGELPLAAFLTRLAGRGYAGYVTLELEPAALPDAPAAIVAALTRLREWMRGLLRSGENGPVDREHRDARTSRARDGRGDSSRLLA